MKKITILVGGILFGFSGYALADNGNNTDNSDVQQQIQQLKKEINQLKSNSVDNDMSSRKKVNTDVLSAVHIDTDAPFAKYSSSRLPFSILQSRNKYGDNSLTFGGYIESDVTGWNGDQLSTVGGGSYDNGWDLSINEASLYTVANIGHYIQAAVTLTGSSYASPEVRDAYVTFGNLDSFPIYLTVGKNRLSFGRFADGGPWIGGLTQAMFRPGHDTVSANLGASFGSIETNDYNLNLNLAVFQTDQSNNNKANFMTSAFFDFDNKKVNFGGSLGYIYNWIGTGMGGAVTAGAGNVVTEDRNGIINAEAYFGIDNIFTLSSGWSGSTNREDYSGDGYFGAWYVQGDIPLPVHEGKILQGLNLGAGYQQAYNTENLPFALPGDESNNGGPMVLGVEKEYLTYLSAPVFSKNNLVSLEYGYLTLYNGQHTSEVTLDISTYF
ncbi:DUF3573 domain-containing protein [Facilibium subflavum]|uniref:DUF3573 domain-containing protein n=1 Tax=Facilibium subflavum TaxID=2219058 RepID=UPI000E64808A|nr:DUF3573 domain-containing protein [Facilibium subflavum]